MKRWGLYLLPALLLPAIGMAYLFNQNCAYLSPVQTLLAALAMIALSGIGYLVLRIIFRSDASAMAGCAAIWVVFFVGGSLLRSQLRGVLSDDRLAAIGVAALTLVLALALALPMRRYRGEALGAIASLMCAALLLMNAVPAVSMGFRMQTHTVDDSIYKTEFRIDNSLPSPNVYWIHADGMLGFQAFEDYFQDSQSEFRQALVERGFDINAGAMLESGHFTAIAIPSLMNPAFYDSYIHARATTHEEFMALRGEKVLLQHELQRARDWNETRLAFEQKGYQSQTLSSLDIYFPPMSERVYEVENTSGVDLFHMPEPEIRFLPMQQWIELSEVLYRASGGLSLGLPVQCLGRQVMDFGVSRERVKTDLTREQIASVLLDAKPNQHFQNMVVALDDLLKTEQTPAFTLLFYPAAHYPFSYNEDGTQAKGDLYDIANYAGNHRYAAKVLVNELDRILAADPDAVIVIQADHGLHGVSGKRIAEFCGSEDAVLPLWNQVTSAIRVPGRYRDKDLQRTMDTPLNMSRYLMNRFVGEQYEYLGKR